MKRYRIVLDLAISEHVAGDKVTEMVTAAASRLAQTSGGTCSVAAAEPKRSRPSQPERLQAATAFTLAFPEVCEMTLNLNGRFIGIERSIRGRWWTERKRGSHVDLADCLSELLGI